jgi:beta-glucosidase
LVRSFIIVRFPKWTRWPRYVTNHIGLSTHVLDSSGLGSRFPRGFVFGAATAAYQIEGAWDADGKGESIWDAFCRVPGAIAGGERGEVACDHYRRYADDVALMAELGLSAYRFSVSWPRVLPNGTGRVNEDGLDFYDRLVDALLERGIRPFVTLYHWDLPQALQNQGGWGSPDAPGWFADYAGLVAARLGDRVRSWMTLNEPEVAAFAGHAYGVHAPGLRDWGLALSTAHHLLRAHAAAAQAIRAAADEPAVGIALNLAPCHAASDAAEDAEAARRLDGYLNRWFLDPLFGRGYPTDMVAWYGDLLPSEAVDETQGLTASLDFLGVNHYTRRIGRASADGVLRAETVTPPDATLTAMGWEVYPDGIRELLLRLQRDYGPTTIFVTENGAAFDDLVEANGSIEDDVRVRFLARYLAAVAEAIDAGVPVEGYFVWTLMDNFEWAHGTSKRFGLVRVDYPTQRRTVKASGRWYRELIGAARVARTPAQRTGA